jgi:putative tricarboxylic transport membrane protein
MIDIITFSLLGSLFGTLVGSLPGINMTVAMVLSIPLIANQSLEVMLAFYISVLIICQYLGSVMAIGAGVPGETNSLPAVHEGSLIRKVGNVKQAIRFTAIGSLLGATVAILMLILNWSLIQYSVYAWQTEIKIIILTGTLIMLVLWSENKIFINLLLVTLGIVLGKIGVDKTTNDVWTPFGLEFFTYGIPFLTVLIVIYALPILWRNSYSPDSHLKNHESTDLLNQYGLPTEKFPYMSSIRGSIIGFFAGFIPALSYSISSKIAWLFEKTKYKQNNYSHSLHRLVSAESANNAASLSAVIPLIMFGVPIIASETILFNLITAKGFVLGPGAIQLSLLSALAAAYLISNLIGFIAAWPLATFVTQAITYHEKKIKIFISVLLVVLLAYEAYHTNLLDIYAIIIVLLIPISWCLRKFDTQPIIFGFVLSGIISQTLFVFFQKYFY